MKNYTFLFYIVKKLAIFRLENYINFIFYSLTIYFNVLNLDSMQTVVGLYWMEIELKMHVLNYEYNENTIFYTITRLDKLI